MVRVRATAFDPDFAQGDCAYHAVHVGLDGRVYFAIGSTLPDEHARIMCFDPGAGRMVYTRDLRATLGQSAGDALSHAKIHGMPGELDGRLYFATMQGDARTDAAPHREYPGFHVMSLDMCTGAIADLARGPAGQGWITGRLDPSRGVYYGLTYPAGLFCRYAIGAKTLEIGSRPCSDWPVSGRRRFKFVYPVCRSVGIDASGAVYGSCRSGAIWRARPGEAPATQRGVNVRQGAVPPVSRSAARHGFWRSVIFDQEAGVFYGIHDSTRSLFRFDPDRGRIDPVCRLGCQSTRVLGEVPGGAQLGLAFGPGRVLYHVSHGPPEVVSGRPSVGSAAYLTSYDVDRGQFREHGPIYTGAGARVLFAESLAFDRHDSLYTVAWVEVLDPEERLVCSRLRAQGSPPLSRGETYRMMLLRIDLEGLDP